MPRKPNRHYLLCLLCLKTKDFLSVHLRRVCMKDSTPEAIGAALEKAKKDVHDLLVSGRVFPYVLLRQILDDADPLSRLTEELQRRHMVVTGIPPPLPNANVIARPSTTQTAESEPSDNTSVSSGKCFQFVSTAQWTTKNRKLMAQRGLYQRHSLDYPLLKDFGLYLERELCNENFKQEVENVARYLYYFDPQQPSLQFVRNREKIRQYLCELSRAKLTKQTQINYLKSLKRFLMYHTINTNLRREDQTLHGDCKDFIDYIGSLQKSFSKQVSKEITQKRHGRLTEKEQLTPRDCLAVLRGRL
ncbi:uncharacterized protein LOC143317613 [Chaetodon auriga]|uniref:uncharacterized protein LOC143317613 n=1 Tax=Chaetodon auriga TaxID=39042 RepID=UPI0040329B7F